MGKQAKIRRERRLKTTKDKRPGPHPGPRRVPYDDPDEAEDDLELVQEAWEEHFGADKVAENYVPPFFTEEPGPDGVPLMHPWVMTFREKLYMKYGDKDLADRRCSFTLAVLVDTALGDETDEPAPDP